MKNALIAVLGVLILAAIIFFTWTPDGRAIWNNWHHAVQESDDSTRYETRRQVEDSCRSMIASYESDRLTWMQYRDSFNVTQRSWADQAKIRANRTASTYNNYVLRNSYVWEGNVPEDIRNQLDYLE